MNLQRLLQRLGASRPPSVKRIGFALILGVVWLAGPFDSYAVTPLERGRFDGDAEELDFNRDIRPILADKCFSCHGPDEGTREADLRLDLEEAILEDRGGYQAIVPGDVEASEVWLRLTTDDDDLRMPPIDSPKPLEPDDVRLIRRWIENGAPYDSHWSFQPIEEVNVPRSDGTSAAVNPIDLFVRRKLETLGVAPSAVASRPTLIRRLYLDLLGLPPSPAAVDAFVSDSRPDAYSRLVDRLLAHPSFGERFGRHWLDQARYADSHGYTNDNARSIWPYRDWVIEAFNSDLAFDRFTVEQLAGDLLPNPTIQQRVATGFHRNTLINNEGGTKPEQFRVEQAKDRIDTTGLVWMGLTIGCAKCHSHKFDPISHHEYYRLYAFFNSTKDVNSVAPTLAIPTASQRIALEEEDARIRSMTRQLEEQKTIHQGDQAAWESMLLQSNDAEPAWEAAQLRAQSKHGATFETLDDGSLLVSGENRASDQYSIELTVPPGEYLTIEMQALTHESLPKNGPGRASNGNLVLSSFKLLDVGGQAVTFARAAADHSQPNYSIEGAIDADPASGWAINGAPEGGANHNRLATFILTEPIAVTEGETLTIVMDFDQGGSPYNLGRFLIRLADREPATAETRELIAILKVEPNQRTDEQKQKVDDHFYRSIPGYVEIEQQRQTATRRRQELQKQIATTMVLEELASSRPTHVHIRGDFLRLGDQVDADVPQILPPLNRGTAPVRIENERTEAIASQSALPGNRLALARWLVRPDHPLTSRVRVNRIWMRLFGRGLVETEDDFGIQGTTPSHPELFDWLAREFQAQSWSTKNLIRLIVTSDTYRQASDYRGELADLDPRNIFLARQNRIRVEAEIVRDLVLIASDLYSDRIGGASVFPPQPDGVYAFTQVRKSWPTSSGSDRYRRGMYTFFYRSAPHPMLSTFDVPRFNQTCTRRDRSNTPLQSLTLANDPALLEMAVAFSARLLDASRADDTTRIEQAFKWCLARTPDASELERLREFVEAERDRWTKRPDLARQFVEAYQASEATNRRSAMEAADSSFVELAVWTSVARVLINLDEFVTRN